MSNKKNITGFTLLEAVFVSAFMGFIFLLLYKAMMLSMKTGLATVGGDSNARTSAFRTAELLSKKIREIDPQNIIICPLSNTETGAILFPGRENNWSVKAQDSDSDSLDQLGYYIDDEQKMLPNSTEPDTIIMFFYDRSGFIDKLKTKHSVPSSHGTLYEVMFKTAQGNIKKASGSIILSDIEKLLSVYIQNKPQYIKYRKIASNIIYFNTSTAYYPLIDFECSFRYGAGGNSSRTEANFRNHTEVFDLNFSVMPYYY